MGLSSLRGSLKTFVQTQASRLTMPQYWWEVGKRIAISFVGLAYYSES
jgi:hypothetical protein